MKPEYVMVCTHVSLKTGGSACIFSSRGALSHVTVNWPTNSFKMVQKLVQILKIILIYVKYNSVQKMYFKFISVYSFMIPYRYSTNRTLNNVINSFILVFVSSSQFKLLFYKSITWSLVSWARIFLELFSNSGTFGSRSGTKYVVRRCQTNLFPGD